MAVIKSLWVLYLLTELGPQSRNFVYAQTFADIRIPVSWPEISPTCAKALNTTISCPTFLIEIVEDSPRLNQANLTSLCTTSCETSLAAAKSKIQTGCSLSTDVVDYYGETYPASLIIDQFQYAYKLRCRKDPVTNKFCDVLFLEWMQKANYTAAEECSDCNLGNVQAQLNSPFGFNAEFAADFRSLTASCTKTGYAFTTPAPYKITTSIDPTATQGGGLGASCYSVYTVKTGDTCDSIALARNVSTYAVWGSNGVDDCSKPKVGRKICLLGPCLQYKVKAGDTCDSIMTGGGLNNPYSFLAWNPNINSMCTNLQKFVGSYICLGRPEGLLNPTLPATDGPTRTASAVWPSFTEAVEPQLPTAPGTLSNCLSYRNWINVVPIQDQFYSPDVNAPGPIVNSCLFVAAMNSVSVSELLAWNPSLNASSCILAAGFSYCEQRAGSVGDVEPTEERCPETAPALIPSGTISSCTCYTVYSGIYKEISTCEDFADWYKITVAKILAWNPWVGSNCTAGLYTGLVDQLDERALCVGTDIVTSSTVRSTSTTSVSQTALSSTSRITTPASSSNSQPQSSTTSAIQTSSSTSPSPSTTKASTTTSPSPSTTTTKASTTTTPSPSTTTTKASTTTTPSPSTTTTKASTTTSPSPSTTTTKASTTTSPSPTTTKASTTTTTSPTTTKAATTTSATAQVCVGGSGPGNYAGLCDFACARGYCPAGVCTCLAYGAQIPLQAVGPVGYPIAGLDSSYLGLCSFCCVYGYCPPTACTTVKP